jgi:hypothetical protein
MKNLVIMDPWGKNFHAVVVLVALSVSAMEVTIHEEIFHYIKRYFITLRDISLHEEILKFTYEKTIQKSPLSMTKNQEHIKISYI